MGDSTTSAPVSSVIVQPWAIERDSVLVLSDAHMDIPWMQAVFAHEQGRFDHIVFNGDLIDSAQIPPFASARKCGEYYREMIESRLFTVHVGNHELPCMESWSANHMRRHRHQLLHACSGYTHSRSIDFNRALTWDHWMRTRVFSLVNGWLVSHAGFRESFWRPLMTESENLAALWRDCETAKERVPFEVGPIMGVGVARGGNERWGGALWNDWKREFEDNLPHAQIVGHSRGDSVRQIGRSFNIDTCQKTYAVIARDGSIRFGALVPDGKGSWKEEAVIIQNDDALVTERRVEQARVDAHIQRVLEGKELARYGQ